MGRRGWDQSAGTGHALADIRGLGRFMHLRESYQSEGGGQPLRWYSVKMRQAVPSKNTYEKTF